MKKTALVYYTLLDKQIEPATEEAWLSQVSTKRRQQLQRMLQPQKRHCSLIALQLLKTGLHSTGYDNFSLDQIHFPDKNKPRWPAGLDFSISHSNDLIACAIALTGQVGIDVEYRRPYNETVTKRILNAAEHDEVNQHPEQFFHYWTAKEAIIKAADCGGVYRMADVNLSGNEGVIDHSHWYLQPLQLHTGYAAHIACDQAGYEVQQNQIAIDLLLDNIS